MSKKKKWELLIRHFENNCSESESLEIQRLLESDGDFKTNFENLKILKEIPGISLPKPDIEKAWQILKERIDTKRVVTPEKQQSVKIYQWFNNYKILKIAAILFIALTLAYFIFKSDSPNLIRYNELIVAKTQTEKILLSDGSYVILDSGSFFKYPQNFTDISREVYLNGEAYFKVTNDIKKPFIVHTDFSQIRVLGTEFNVRAWNNSEKIVVAVKEGKVAFKSDNSKNPGEEVVIHKNQYSMMLENYSPALPQETDIKTFFQWQNREMYFQNVPLQEVFDQLKRWYNLKINVPDNSLTSNRVTIFLENKNINEILDVISLMNNIQYERDGLQVVFYYNN